MQIVTTLCDICHDEGEETNATETVVIQVNRRGTELDMCQHHIDTLMKLLDQHFVIGRRPGNISVLTPTSRNRNSGEFPCDNCERTFSSLQGVAMHPTRSHSILSQSREAIRKREQKANGGELPPGMTHSEADSLLDRGECIYDTTHGPFPNRAGAGSHIRGTHGVSLSALGLSRPPGSRRHAHLAEDD